MDFEELNNNFDFANNILKSVYIPPEDRS